MEATPAVVIFRPRDVNWGWVKRWHCGDEKGLCVYDDIRVKSNGKKRELIFVLCLRRIDLEVG